MKHSCGNEHEVGLSCGYGSNLASLCPKISYSVRSITISSIYHGASPLLSHA